MKLKQQSKLNTVKPKLNMVKKILKSEYENILSRRDILLNNIQKIKKNLKLNKIQSKKLDELERELL